MADYLKYDTANLETNRTNIEEKRTAIKDSMDSITKAIGSMKGNWETAESKKVFDMVDGDWVKGINATLETLEDLYTSIDNAAKAYQKIEEEAKRSLTF